MARRFVLILGPGRSGTTLVREILNRHSKISIVPESGYYDRLWAARRLLGSIRRRENVARWLHYFLFRSHDPAMACYRDRLPGLISYFSAHPPRNFDKFFVEIVARLDEDRRPEVIGEKTPRHLLYWRRIAKGIPDARFIVTTRDPRAVVASIIKRGDLFRETYKAAIDWRIHMEHARAMLRQRGFKVMVTNYESLIRSSEEVIRSMTSFLSVDFEEPMLAGGAWNSSYGPRNGPQQGSGIYRDSLDRWRDVLSSDDVRTVERITGPLMKEFGFERLFPDDTPRLRWREKPFYLGYGFQKALGMVGVRPIRAYLQELRSKVTK